jgi:dienelactone hydrolase
VRTRLTAVAVATGLVAASGAALAAPGRHAAPPPRLEQVAGLPDGVPAAALRPEKALPRAGGWPFAEAWSRTSGTGRLAAGAAYWSDFVYDDHGAVGPQVETPIAALAATDGTYSYPAGPAKGNGADIFRNAVGVDDAASYWRVDWNTLVDPRVPTAEWALDTDGSTATGVAAWPAGAGVRSAGIEKALLVSSRGAWVIDAATGRRLNVSRGLTVDRAARSFVVRVPRATLPVAGTWRVRLAAGLANPAGDGFAPVTPDRGASPGEPAVWNVSYRTYLQEPQQYRHGIASNQVGTGNTAREADQGNYWMEDHQAEALTAGDVSDFGYDLDWARLTAQDSTPEPLVRGWSNRWYVTDIDLGQGVVHDDAGTAGDLKPNFLGRIQPYGVYVPSTYSPGEATPLTWMLHSLSVMHNQYGALDPEQVRATCENRRSICATPLGRGPDGWYFDEAEADFWAVWNRLAHAYTLDPERTVISGYSMGGYGSYKLGLTYPDLFAKAMPLAGPPTCGVRVHGDVRGRSGSTTGRCATDGDTTLLVGNARNLPYVMADGGLDELVPYTSVREQVMAFDAAGYRYHFETYPAEGHIPYAAKDGFAVPTAQLGRTVRESAAARIDYTWQPHLVRSDYGIGPTGVYWLRDLVARGSAPGSLAHVVARSGGIAEALVTPVKTQSAYVPGDPSPALVEEQTWRRTGTAPIGNGLDLSLAGVRSLRVDAGRAGLDGFSSLAVSLASDGPATVTVTGLAPGVTLHVKGGATVRADGSGTAVLHVG